MDAVKLKLITTVIEIIVAHGIPAATEFFQNLSSVDAITVEEIEALYGKLDAADYFPDLDKEP